MFSLKTSFVFGKSKVFYKYKDLSIVSILKVELLGKFTFNEILTQKKNFNYITFWLTCSNTYSRTTTNL